MVIPYAGCVPMACSMARGYVETEVRWRRIDPFSSGTPGQAGVPIAARPPAATTLLG
jgi:hypothetical protein